MPDSKEPLTLRETVKVLREHYGSPEPLQTRDPFELILWENIAYLAPSVRRREAFDELKRTIGTAPAVILKAAQQTLECATGGGILKSEFAAKLRQCAIIAVTDFDGDLGQKSHRVKDPRLGSRPLTKNFYATHKGD